VAYSALEIALYGYAAANPRVVRGFHAQDTHGGGRGNRCLSQSFDWADAASCSRRTLLTMGYMPISPAAAIIYESIHSGALNGSVDSWSACWSAVASVALARPGGYSRRPVAAPRT
jgi:hypothetical protein